MTDVRKCDNCKVEAPLDEPVELQIGGLRAGSFITVECPTQSDIHFCNRRCLIAYYEKENGGE